MFSINESRISVIRKSIIKITSKNVTVIKTDFIPMCKALTVTMKINKITAEIKEEINRKIVKKNIKCRFTYPGFKNSSFFRRWTLKRFFDHRCALFRF